MAVENKIFVFHFYIIFNLSPFGFILASDFKGLQYFSWLRITEEGSIPEMRIWSISLTQSD